MMNKTPGLAGRVDYSGLLASLNGSFSQAVIAALSEELPHLWRDAYLAMTPVETNICRILLASFEYLFDDCATLEAQGLVAQDRKRESRLVAVFGHSAPQKRSRDDSRLQGWPGRPEARFGKRWDKGHFIAHSIGGAVDQWELNVFLQRRDLNRGWSRAGKLYRSMETYCALHPGTFCFSRPIYMDGSARPALLEFGILKAEGELWVEVFKNHYRRYSTSTVR